MHAHLFIRYLNCLIDMHHCLSIEAMGAISLMELSRALKGRLHQVEQDAPLFEGTETEGAFLSPAGGQNCCFVFQLNVAIMIAVFVDTAIRHPLYNARLTAYI